MMDLVPAQIATLEKLSRAGFKFVSLTHVERYLSVQKNGFVALLNPSADGLRVFGQAGLRMGEGIGMLIEQGAGKAFVWKRESVPATSELLADFARFKAELQNLLMTE